MACWRCNRIRVARQRKAKERRALRKAKQKAIKCGKVIELYAEDEFTGIHYKVAK